MNTLIMKKRHIVLCSIGFILSFFIFTNAHAVRSAEHYDRQARESKIKAIAVVKAIEVISKTKYSTHKRILFELQTGFEDDIPAQFTGTCYSVDHAWQQPLAGGTIYYYPAKGEKVLVTVSNNSGKITSFTSLTRDLLEEIRLNGITHISFSMGRAQINRKNEKWFLFHLKDKISGYLSFNVSNDRENNGIFQLSQEFLIGEVSKDRTLFKIDTQYRDDHTFTPEWISKKIISYSNQETITYSEREFGFRPTSRSNIQEGILTKGDDNAYDLSIPEQTTTDFLLFLLIETLPFQKESSFKINLIETLELHLKKNILIQYKGRDKNHKNLHKFSQTGSSSGNYWLDENHKIIKVLWDKDKQFIKCEKSEAMTSMQ